MKYRYALVSLSVSIALLISLLIACKGSTTDPTPVVIAPTRAQVIAKMTTAEQYGVVARAIETVKGLKSNLLGTTVNPETVIFSTSATAQKTFTTDDIVRVDSVKTMFIVANDFVHISPLISIKGQVPFVYDTYKKTINGADYYVMSKTQVPAAVTNPKVNILTTPVESILGLRFAVP